MRRWGRLERKTKRQGPQGSVQGQETWWGGQLVSTELDSEAPELEVLTVHEALQTDRVTAGEEEMRGP